METTNPTPTAEAAPEWAREWIPKGWIVEIGETRISVASQADSKYFALLHNQYMALARAEVERLKGELAELKVERASIVSEMTRELNTVGISRDRMMSERDRLQSEADALREKAECMDWLNANPHHNIGIAPGLRYIMFNGECFVDLLSAVKEQIADAARAALKEGEEEACPHCLRVECECSDADVSPEMGAR